MKHGRIRCKGASGFSLAELIIVLAILGVLSALALSRMTFHRVHSMNSACTGIMSLLKRAADAYYADTGELVESVQDLATTHYLTAVPQDPHDTRDDYTILLWYGEQVRVRCPFNHAVYFPPGHPN